VGFGHDWTFDPGIWLRQVRFSPALAAVLLLVGFGRRHGSDVPRDEGRARPIFLAKTAGANVSPPTEDANITGIRSITLEPGANTLEPGTKRVNIKYDT